MALHCRHGARQLHRLFIESFSLRLANGDKLLLQMRVQALDRGCDSSQLQVWISLSGGLVFSGLDHSRFLV